MGTRSERASRPGLLPWHQSRVADERILRLSKREGQRQLLFLPAAVLKLGLNRSERRALVVEAERSAAAARHAFWAGLTVGTLAVVRAGLLSRRFPSVQLTDFDAVAQIVEERLEACIPLPRHPIPEELLRRSQALALLDAAERDGLSAMLEGQLLPRSSMHGDLHFFNFVRSGAGFRIIDWEHFDPDGSFVFDYVDFHVSVDHVNRKRYWPDTLDSVDAGHPALQRAAAASGTAPQALLAHYLLLKIDTMIARRGGPGGIAPTEWEDLLAVLRRAIVPDRATSVWGTSAGMCAAPGANAWGAGVGMSSSPAPTAPAPRAADRGGASAG